MSINEQPLEHTSSNGTKFKATHCDLSKGVMVTKYDYISEVRFAQDVAEFTAWHRGQIWEQLNGFSGYDCIQFVIVTITR